MRIVFMGTPGFAVPGLVALLENGYDVVEVITQPDRPRLRGRKVLPSPVKQEASARGLSVAQYEKINSPEPIKRLQALAPDAIVVIAYGQILPAGVLQIPVFGCINVHASLLPKYRGAAPIQWALIRGEKVTGVTTMHMDEGLDTGDILLQRAISIEDNDTAGSLHDKLSKTGASLIVETLEGLAQGRITPTPQDHRLATYAPILKKEDGLIDWASPAGKINDLIRGTNPWPGAYTFVNGTPLKILEAEAIQGDKNAVPGEVIQKVKNRGFVVKCGCGALLIKSVQLPGTRALSAQEYLTGHSLNVGDLMDRG